MTITVEYFDGTITTVTEEEFDIMLDDTVKMLHGENEYENDNAI